MILDNFLSKHETINGITAYDADTPTSDIAIDIAIRLEKTTEAGHGVFLNYDQTPEIKERLIDYLQHFFGWTLERKYFIRKPV